MSKRKVKVLAFGTVCDLCNRLMYTPDEPMAADDKRFIHIKENDFHTACIEKVVKPFVSINP